MLKGVRPRDGDVRIAGPVERFVEFDLTALVACQYRTIVRSRGHPPRLHIDGFEKQS